MDLFFTHLSFWLCLTGFSSSCGCCLDTLIVVLLLLAATDYFRLVPVRLWGAQAWLSAVSAMNHIARRISKKPYKSIIGTTASFSARVWPGDCDTYMHMNNSQYNQKCEWGRFAIEKETGILHRIRRYSVWGLSNVTVRFRRELKPLQKYTVRTRLCGWNSNTFFLEHIVETMVEDRAERGKMVPFANAHALSLLKLVRSSKYTCVEILAKLGEDVDVERDKERMNDGLRAIERFEAWSSAELGGGKGPAGGKETEKKEN
eukprot:Hpha_TRINITY_DN29615_c0_g1::TRINITY_DN29615_c0_g1_i1::g.165201::m.165201